MDLALTEEQEALRDAVARMLAKTSSPELVRESESSGFSEAVWQGFAEMGVPTMGVADIGGAALADLAVVAREAGSALAPAPVVEAMVANRLLALLGRDVDDATIRTLAVRPSRDGVATLVPGAAVAAEIVALDGADLVLIEPPAPLPAVTTMGSASLADVATRGEPRTVLASGPDASQRFAVALDEWRSLTAQWLIGLARGAFDIGVQYVKDRKQFGVPIGSFQAVQHQLATIATALDGAALLADKAVWALDSGDSAAATFPAMAFTNAAEVAEAAASAALHHHGGYGFMEEYDIQLYFRRAKATRLLLGDPRRELQGLADRLFGPIEGAA